MLEERLKVIQEIFGDVYYNSFKNEAVVFCPKHSHHKKKLQINIKKNFFHCWVCGYAGRNIYALLKDIATQDQKRRYLSTIDDFYVDDSKVKEVLFPDDYEFILKNPKTFPSNACISYLKENGINEDVMLKAKIGVCKTGRYFNRIIYPSFDKGGNLNFFVARSISPKSYKKYLFCEQERTNVVFNELFMIKDRPVIIVEGVKTHFVHFGIPNVVPILGTSLRNNSKLFKEIVLNSYPKVYLALDNDAKDKALDIARALSGYGTEVYIVDVPVQPDEISSVEFLDLVTKAEKYVPESFDLLVERIKTI